MQPDQISDPRQDVGYDPSADLHDVDQATRRLLRTASGLGPSALAGDSLCPGWTRGHVLTHVARNADSLRRLLRWATSGIPTFQYPDRASRDADIDAGAGRAPADQLNDVTESARWLAEAVLDVPVQGWARTVRVGAGGTGASIPAAQVLWRRLLELELHHVDLARTYTPAHWPQDFVRRALPYAANRMAERADAPRLAMQSIETGETWSTGPAPELIVSGPAPALLAWITGRSNGDGLQARTGGAAVPLPAVPAWG